MSFYPLATDTWDDAEIAAINRVVASRQFTMGREVRAFEEQFASTFGSRFAVMVNSGSSANLLALAGLVYHPKEYLKRGDQVIVPAVSWSTTFFPVHQLGLELRFVDVERKSLNIDPTLVEAAITDRTKAILAVNLLGNPCDFDRLMDIARRYGLTVIEDNCESMGAVYLGKKTGTFGLCGTFSTFFSHHISTMEGGMVVTDDEALYHTFLSLRAHGWIRDQPAHSHLNLQVDDLVRSYRFVLPGYNLRPIEIEAAIGSAQLVKLPHIVAERRKNAQLFAQAVGDLPDVETQSESGESSWFGFSLLLQNRLAGTRADLVRRLQAAEIESRPIVAGNFIANPVIQYLNHSVPAPMPVADDIDRNGLFIGNHHYGLSEQLERLRRVLREFVAGMAA